MCWQTQTDDNTVCLNPSVQCEIIRPTYADSDKPRRSQQRDAGEDERIEKNHLPVLHVLKLSDSKPTTTSEPKPGRRTLHPVIYLQGHVTDTEYGATSNGRCHLGPKHWLSVTCADLVSKPTRSAEAQTLELTKVSQSLMDSCVLPHSFIRLSPRVRGSLELINKSSAEQK